MVDLCHGPHLPNTNLIKVGRRALCAQRVMRPPLFSCWWSDGRQAAGKQPCTRLTQHPTRPAPLHPHTQPPQPQPHPPPHRRPSRSPTPAAPSGGRTPTRRRCSACTRSRSRTRPCSRTTSTVSGGGGSAGVWERRVGQQCGSGGSSGSKVAAARECAAALGLRNGSQVTARSQSTDTRRTAPGPEGYSTTAQQSRLEVPNSSISSST